MREDFSPVMKTTEKLRETGAGGATKKRSPVDDD